MKQYRREYYVISNSSAPKGRHIPAGGISHQDKYRHSIRPGLLAAQLVPALRASRRAADKSVPGKGKRGQTLISRTILIPETVGQAGDSGQPNQQNELFAAVARGHVRQHLFADSDRGCGRGDHERIAFCKRGSEIEVFKLPHFAAGVDAERRVAFDKRLLRFPMLNLWSNAQHDFAGGVPLG